MKARPLKKRSDWLYYISYNRANGINCLYKIKGNEVYGCLCDKFVPVNLGNATFNIPYIKQRFVPLSREEVIKIMPQFVV